LNAPYPVSGPSPLRRSRRVARHALRLIDDPELAARIGRETQKNVADKFSRGPCQAGLRRAIESTRRKWRERQKTGRGASEIC